MVSARPPPSSSHTLPSAPNPSARTVPAVTGPAATGSDTIQRVPFHHAASRLFPAASRATLPPAVAASPSTCTVSFPGSTSPADRQVPPVSVNTPATPGRVQLPAAIGLLPGPNETACTLTSPQERPGADAASALRVVSCVHCPAAAALAVGAACDGAVLQQREGAPRRADRDGARGIGQAGVEQAGRPVLPGVGARRQRREGQVSGWGGSRRPARCSRPPPPARRCRPRPAG